ncbi:MAG: hypothetical protein MI673_08385 [Thiotrichales bacterium]|nr:hypothetical protein [Thiotrichales bacterium]
MKLKRKQLLELYQRLYKSYGPQHWWPARSRFEVMVGAILTQNTAWTNVERAITNLKKAHCLHAEALLELRDKQLAHHLRPSGYFNIKTRRVKSFCRWYLESGQYRRLKNLHTDALRNELLSVNGIGPETADDILLYAFERPVFVIDAYTRRLLARLGWADGDEHYETLRAAFETALDPDTALFNEYHALIVRHAKEKCSGKSDCRHCYIEKSHN